MAGGGSTTAIIRAADALSPLADYLFGASDVGGVAERSVSADDTWKPLTGLDGTQLLTQPELSIFDLLPSSWGELFAIGGRESTGGNVSGGLYAYDNYPGSDIQGGEWQTLVNSNPSTSDTAEVTVAAVGYYSACNTRLAYAGGRLLVGEFLIQ